jgi:Xaa-Pro aminopeptidase
VSLERRDALRRHLAELEVDALLVTDLLNVRYLTGFTGSAGSLLVGSDGEEDHLVIDGRYAEQAAQQAPDLRRVVTRERDWLLDAVPPGAEVGLESSIPWGQAEAVAGLLAGRRVVPVTGAVEALRGLKDDAELARIRRACEITGAALLATLDRIRPGITEVQVARALERTMVDLGAEDRAFATIVASGPNGARPHHRPGDRRLERGDLVTIDMGALVDGYHADMTRLVALGEPTGEQRRLADAVLAAQRAGVTAARGGLTAGDLDAVCRDHLRADGLAEAFVHGTGHGIGLAVHEAPILSAGASATLRPQMVVTVEPGAYVPGLGGARVEDTVLLTAEGADVLTAVPSDVVVL